MSYILEALHRADAERQLRGAGVPDLNTHHETTHKRSPRRLGWIVAVALSLNLLLVLLLWQRDDPPTDAATGEARAAPVAHVASTATSSIEEPTVAQPDAEARLPDQTVATAQRLPAPLVATPPPRSAPLMPQLGPPAPGEQAGTVVRPTVTAAAPAPRPEPHKIVTAVPLPAVTSPASRASGPADDAVDWRDLPSAERRKLPRPRLDVHVYAELPERRFVMINMNRYREGETLPENVLLESITTEGVILDYQGQRYRLPRR